MGHLEWVEFLRVPRLPKPGDIIHATEWWQEPAGGGPAAAEQMRKLGAETWFFTALGDDELGHRSLDELSRRGLNVHAAFRDDPTRRAVTHVDAKGERTITVIGERLAARSEDDLPWHLLADMDAVYFTAGDSGALRYAREAAVLTATARTLDVLTSAPIKLDALVGSRVDPGERFRINDLDIPPKLAVWTDGERGGSFVGDGVHGTYEPQALPGPVVDRYGAGDAFAAGLTVGLGWGMPLADALVLGARCGAAVVTGRGPYEGQLQIGENNSRGP